MKLFCVFFLSCITIGKASSLMGEDNGGIFANPTLRGLQTICSDSGNDPRNGGDCSNTPTICGSGGNAVFCFCDKSRLREVSALPVEYCNDSTTYNRIECGGCSGDCSGENNCLNLDFYCAEGQGCELSCKAKNSCKGVTLHCPDNQICNLNCSGEGSCVDAEVRCGKGTVANSVRYIPYKVFSCTVPTIDPTSAPVSPVPDPTSAPVSPVPDPTNAPVSPAPDPTNVELSDCEKMQKEHSVELDKHKDLLEAERKEFLETEAKFNDEISTLKATYSQLENEMTTIIQNLREQANACCSYDFKTCATWGNESRQTCEALGTMLWLENGPLVGNTCLGTDTECTNNTSGCCYGLECQGTDSYRQCKNNIQI